MYKCLAPKNVPLKIVQQCSCASLLCYWSIQRCVQQCSHNPIVVDKSEFWLDHKWCVCDCWPAPYCEGGGLALWRKLVKDPGGIIENLYCALLSFRALWLFCAAAPSTSSWKPMNFSESCWSQDCCCFTHRLHFGITRMRRVCNYFSGVSPQCMCKFECELS